MEDYAMESEIWVVKMESSTLLVHFLSQTGMRTTVDPAQSPKSPFQKVIWGKVSLEWRTDWMTSSICKYNAFILSKTNDKLHFIEPK